MDLVGDGGCGAGRRCCIASNSNYVNHVVANSSSLWVGRPDSRDFDLKMVAIVPILGVFVVELSVSLETFGRMKAGSRMARAEVYGRVLCVVSLCWLFPSLR